MARVAAPPPAPRVSLRAFAQSRHFCGLTLSPAMAAIMDASEGLPVELEPAACLALFGCPASALPRVAPVEVDVMAGGRGGKSSRLLAVKALHAALTVHLPTLRRGEVARSLLVAPDTDLATQVLNYAKGYVAGSEVMRSMVVDSGPGRGASEDEDEDADVGTAHRILLRRPHDGHLVELVVKAARRGGTTARSRTLVFCALDEACFFYAGDGYTVTDRAIYDAAIQRLVPGAQIWVASTPWLEGEGVLAEAIERNWGRHTDALVAVAPTRVLNPSWDPDGRIERKMRAQDPENARREIDAVPLGKGAEHMYHRDAIRRALELQPPLGRPDAVGFGGDAGFTRDASAVAGVGRWDGAGAPWLAALVGAELRPEPGRPLKPSAVVDAWASELAPWPGAAVVVDGHYREAIREHAAGHGLGLLDAPTAPVVAHLETRKALDEGRLALGGLGHEAREALRVQLGAVRRKVQPGGGLAVILPRSRAVAVGGGGGHCDLVAALVLAVWQAGRVAESEAVAEGYGMRRGGFALGGRR